jgi:hypothetical protein
MEQDRYMALNGKYLRDATVLLERGDYPQASEKLWGATAQAVKAIASKRRWRHSSDRDLRNAISRIYKETGDPELLTLFSIAESLHANFYEDYLDGDAVRIYSSKVRELIQKLDAPGLAEAQ